MKRKEAVYKGLQYIDVWITDTSLTSPDYFQISEFPTRLTAGKNLFKFRGHPTNLRVGSYLNIEVLDYNGDPIYHEVVNYIDEDKSRVVAIYIYEDTSPGDCTVTLTGESENVPTEWRGKTNIKWTRTVPVNPNISNDTEIIFETLPTVTISEQVGVQLNRTYPNNTQFPTYTTGKVRYFYYNGQPAVEISGGLFTSDMSTGTITVTTPINATPTPTYTISNTVYESSIKKILSNTTALLDTEYTVYSSQSITAHTYTEFDYSTFSLAYEATPVYTATQNSESFALIQVEALQPATGDVSRIKTFMSNNGTVGTWELINDVELDETEIFVANTASLYPDESIGIFYSQSVIDIYWEAAAYQGLNTLTAPTLLWTTQSINNAMLISSAINIEAQNTILIAQHKPSYNGLFIENSSYKVTFDALGTRSGSVDPKLSVYISGSSFDFDSTDYFNQEFPKRLGKRIGELQITSDNQRFDDYVFEFDADRTGTGVLIFVVESGVWQIADIRTTSDNETGYTPDYTRLRSLVPTAHKSDNQLSFKLEYYNVSGEKSKQISYVYNKNWEGGNRYVDGDYSMLTGSLYVADSLESGVAISGYKNTGYIRSLGYEGFAAGLPGFLIWSGSALSGSQGTKGGVPYSGVGIELYANTESYFRYSTTDSEIDIRTDSFFFGQYPAPFISGANGNIQISASNFHLSPQGNVTASNALFTGVALANIIRDKTITITEANSGSYLSTTGTNSSFPIGTGYTLVLDGGLGGEIVRRARISCSLAYPIFSFSLPNIDTTAKIDVVLEFSKSNYIYDVFSIGKSAFPVLTPPSISLSEGTIISLVPAGDSGTRMLVQYGTEMPSDYIFKQDVTISGSVFLPNISSATTSDVIYYNSSTKQLTYGTAGGGGGGGVTINNNTNNYVVTATGTANTLNGESNLQFNGSTLAITGNVTANSYTGSLQGTSSWSVNSISSSYINGLTTKNNLVSAGSFTGTPLKATVTFTTPFLNNNYSITVTGEDSRTWTIENKVSGSFVINSNSSVALSGNAYWQALNFGEFQS